MNSKQKNRQFIMILVLSISFLGIFSPILAADTFNLAYTLTEGGYQLALDATNYYKGINLSVDSSIAVRYEVVQRIIQPLASRDNLGQVIQNNFVVHGISGSNRFGNLRFSTANMPVRSEDIIYTSDAAGSADNFSLVYGLANPESLAPGYYSGRISFTLNPIGSGQQQITKILEVYVSIADQGQSKPRIQISTLSGAKYLTLSSKQEKNQASGDVLVKINSAAKKQFNIIQLMSEPLESEDGSIIDNETVSFMVKNTQKGNAVDKITALSTGAQNIYTSAMDGSADNNFVITYLLGDLSKLKVGKYKSRMQYLYEEAGAQTKIDNLELIVDNERIFDLIASPQDQKYAIEFRDLKPLGQPKTSEVILEVKSNIGKPYQINQDISGELANKQGQEISSKYFKFHTENIDAKGNLKFIKEEEIKKGNNIIFTSDNLGTPAKIKVIYELTTPMEVKAGDYSANVTYSLLEM